MGVAIGLSSVLSCPTVAWDYFKVGVDKTSQLSKKLNNPEILVKIGFAFFNALALIPGSKRLKAVARGFKEIKGFMCWLKGSRSLRDLLFDDMPWHKTVYNLLCLSLTFFATLDYIALFKGSPTYLHNTVKKYAIFEIIGIAGLIGTVVNLYDLWEAIEDHNKLIDQKEKIKNKIELWSSNLQQNITSSRNINEAIPEGIFYPIEQTPGELETPGIMEVTPGTPENLDKKVDINSDDQVKVLQKVNDFLASSTFTSLVEVNRAKQAFLTRKVKIWQLRLDQNEVEQKIIRTNKVTKVYKVGVSVATTVLSLTPVGALSISIFKAGTYLVDCYPDSRNYFDKKTVSEFKDQIETIKTKATAAA